VLADRKERVWISKEQWEHRADGGDQGGIEEVNVRVSPPLRHEPNAFI